MTRRSWSERFEDRYARRFAAAGVALCAASMMTRGRSWKALPTSARPAPGLLLLIALVLPLAGCGSRETPALIDVTVPRHAALMSVPPSFFGFSTEYWTLPVDERHITLYGRVISLLRVPGDGPFVLRVGGDSSDYTIYGQPSSRIPSWAFNLTPQFVARTVRVTRGSPVRVILDLNLITATPATLRAGVREAERALPPRAILGYEIGNEPDLYDRRYWLHATRDQTGVRVPRALTPLDYASAYDAYARGLAQLAPGAPLFAPAAAYPSSGLRFIRTLLAGPHPGLRVVTGHDYPYSACVPRHSRDYPTIGRLLSEQATAGMARAVRPELRLARAAGLSVRLTEINSVTCGGLRGVSDTFATALWAPDALFELVRAGVAAVNLHARVFAVNDPFTFDAHGLQVHPLLYGLILFIRTLGRHAQLASVHLSRGATHFRAWAVKIAGGKLHVLLLNKGSQPLRIRLALPATAPAQLQRMLAPSVTSRDGETLAGQSLDHEARWSGSSSTQLVHPHAGKYLVPMPPYSAALLSVPIAGPFT